MLTVTKICKESTRATKSYKELQTTGATSVSRQLLVQTSLQLQPEVVCKRNTE